MTLKETEKIQLKKQIKPKFEIWNYTWFVMNAVQWFRTRYQIFRLLLRLLFVNVRQSVQEIL